MRYVYKKPHVRALMRAYDTFGRFFLRRRLRRLSGPPRRIALLLLHQIGDAIMALPTIQAVGKAFPDAELHVIIGSIAERLLAPSLSGATLHCFDAAWDATVKHTFGAESPEGSESALGNLLLRLQPDAALAFHPDVRVNRALGVSRIPISIAFGNAGGGFWLTDVVDMPVSGHQVERNFALARRLGKVCGVDFGLPGAPRLSISEEASASVREQLGDSSGQRLAALHPFGRFSSRNWSIEGWAAVIGAIEGRGMIPALVGGPKDSASQFLERSTRAIDMTGKLSLPETAALLKMCGLFVGIDSGPGHIAAAVGCPVVSVFSAANTPERWAPFGDNVEVVTPQGINREQLPLEVTDLAEGVTTNPYTEGITPEGVIVAIEKVLKRAGK